MSARADLPKDLAAPRQQMDVSLAASEPLSGAAASPAEAGATLPSLHAAYAAHFAALWRLAVRLGIPPRHADDVVHDAFVVAWEKRGQLDPTRPVKPWLAGIVVRRAAGWRRKRDNQGALDTDLDALRDPSTPADALRAHRIVHTALATLTPDHRAVLTLCDLEGFTAVEASTILDVPTGTIYSRLHEARARFTAAVRRTQELP